MIPISMLSLNLMIPALPILETRRRLMMVALICQYGCPYPSPSLLSPSIFHENVPCAAVDCPLDALPTSMQDPPFICVS